MIEKYVDVLNMLNMLFPLFMAFLSWYLWSLKQKFVLKKDFEEFQKEYYKDNKTLSERLVKIETYMESMSSSILEIKEYLFKRKRKD